MGGRSMKDVGGAVLAGSTPPFLGRERAAVDVDDDDVYYYIRWRLELEGETENMGVCTKERKGVTAAVLMATPCTNSLGGESGGQKHEGREGRSACWKYAAVSGSGAGGRRC